MREGTLRNSIHSQADASGFAVGTNVKYAAEHQFGDERTIRARKKPYLCFKVGGQWVKKKAVTIRIPARPYLGFSDDDMHDAPPFAIPTGKGYIISPPLLADYYLERHTVIVVTDSGNPSIHEYQGGAYI